MADYKEQREFTDRPAPMLGGLYSMQAVSGSKEKPDITVYREQAFEAVAWKTRMASERRFERYLLRHAKNAWDVYKEDGTLECLCSDVVSSHIRELATIIEVDEEVLVQDARDCLPERRLQLIATAAGHAGARAVDHSNASIMLRNMVVEADGDDLQHVFLVENKRWECRVLSLFVDVASLSAGMQDRYMDRYRWLDNKWPLNKHHFLDTLATRLLYARKDYGMQVLEMAAREEGWPEEDLRGLKCLWGTTRDYEAARRIVGILSAGVYVGGEGPERFDEDLIRRNSRELMGVYQHL